MQATHNLQPDRIFYNGNLITMAACSGTAVAVLDGSICAVGSDREIIGLAGPDTERTDLSGKTMLPGFYDTHGHFPSAGLVAVSSVNCNSPPMGPVEKIDDIVQLLAERAKGTPEGQWVLGRGYDDTLLEGKTTPHANRPGSGFADPSNLHRPHLGPFCLSKHTGIGTRWRPFRHAQSNGRSHSQRPHHGRAGRRPGRNRNASREKSDPPLNEAQWFEDWRLQSMNMSAKASPQS